jgi:surface polysaccharide O-acyltransferase-like enzyme
MAFIMGLNCAMLGNLWAVITWAAAKATLGRNERTLMRQFQVAANGARWIFWAIAGATLLVPLIVVIVWIALHFLVLFVGIPVMIYKQ